MCGHPSHLSVTALPDTQFNPTGGYGLSQSYWWMAFPDSRIVYQAGSCWPRWPILKFYAPRQRRNGIRVDSALYLYPVAFLFFEARIADSGLQLAIVGEYQKALRVAIQSTGHVKPRAVDEVCQGGASLLVSKLAEDTVRLVKE